MYKTILLIFLASFSLLSDHSRADAESPVLADLKMIYPGEITIGAESAPVTLIAYINYACAYCAIFENEVLPSLKNFVDNGKLKLVYRVFPMTHELTSNNLLFSELAVCSAQFDRFREISNILFNNQGKNLWEHYEAWTGPPGGEASAGIRSCLTFHKTRHYVLAIQQRYAFHGIRVTPTIFVNGHKMEGIHPYSEYEKEIKSLLEER